MKNIEEITAEILRGYANILKETGSQLTPDSNLSLDQYLHVREIAKKEMYLYNNKRSKKVLTDNSEEFFLEEKEDIRYQESNDSDIKCESHTQKEQNTLSETKEVSHIVTALTDRQEPEADEEEEFDESQIFARLEE